MNPPDQNGGHVNNLDGDEKEKRVYKVVLTGGLFQYYAEITVQELQGGFGRQFEAMHA